eukprot:1385363-Pyramimonas_sp.AAC.2
MPPQPGAPHPPVAANSPKYGKNATENKEIFEELKITLERREQHDVPSNDKTKEICDFDNSWAGVSLVLGIPRVVDWGSARGLYALLLTITVPVIEAVIVYLLKVWTLIECAFVETETS